MLLENKFQLPLFHESDALPTGKHHVSYSEINIFLECSYKHKLMYIDKVGQDAGSIHTEYGQVVHDLLENFLKTKSLPLTEEVTAAKQEFRKKCKKLQEVHGVAMSEKDMDEFAASIDGVVESAKTFLDNTFPGWEPVAAEFNLFESIKGHKNRWFKGYIDSVIKIPRKRKKKDNVKSNQEVLRFSDLEDTVLGESGKESKPVIDNVNWEYVIIDWKTTKNGWPVDKKRDFNKQLQLVLYKHYFCNIFNLDLTDVKCSFVLIKRQAKKSDGSRVELVPVSVGPKTEEKGVAILNSMIKQVSSGRVIKNRNSCRYCPYYATEHCT